MKNNDLSREWSEYLAPYQFSLPDSAIARHPAPRRQDARLMILHRKSGQIEEDSVSALDQYLQKNDLLIRNVTAVSWRRVRLCRRTGGEVETLFLTTLENPSQWRCLIRGERKLKSGEILLLKEENGVSARAESACCHFQYDGLSTLSAWKGLPGTEGRTPLWKNGEESEAFFHRYGEVPLPPYLKRSPVAEDRKRYQTLYAATPGSVAAPTAGLHFSADLEKSLSRRGVITADVELNIGYGTFAPLTDENFRTNSLHSESYFLPDRTAQLLNQSFRRIAIGTTTLRVLESEYLQNEGIYKESRSWTTLFVRPPAEVHSIDALITNFHLPGSSLLLLVAAFAGADFLMNAYRQAVKSGYRFYSYGDAMLIL